MMVFFIRFRIVIFIVGVGVGYNCAIFKFMGMNE